MSHQTDIYIYICTHTQLGVRKKEGTREICRIRRVYIYICTHTLTHSLGCEKARARVKHDASDGCVYICASDRCIYICIYMCTCVPLCQFGVRKSKGTTRQTDVYICIYMRTHIHTHSWGCGKARARVKHDASDGCIYICAHTLTHTVGGAEKRGHA